MSNQSALFTIIALPSEKSIKFLDYCDEDLPVVDSEETYFALPLISSLVQVEEEHKDKSIANIVKKYFPKSKTIVYNPKADCESILKDIHISSNSKIVYMTYNGHLFKEQLKAVESLSNICKSIIVIALRNPYDIFECKLSRTKGASFGFRTPSIEALLEILKGLKKPSVENWPVKTVYNQSIIA